jgi:hypothetical protein
MVRRGHVDSVPADDELVAIDVRVVDAAGVEMFPDQADRDFLDRDRVREGPQLLVERDQEMPLDGHTSQPILVVFAGPVRSLSGSLFEIANC